MKRILAGALLLVMMLAAAPGCAAAREDVWMYAVSAGKADAILIGVGDATVLVDAGYVQTRGRILAAMEKMGVDGFDAVFITHADDDHVGGLEWLADSDIRVDAWYASAAFTEVKESKHPAVKAAEARGTQVEWLRAGDVVAVGSAVMRVLAPISVHEDKDDNNSLVMMLETTEGSILLAGDMEFPQEAEVLASGADLDCDVLKVANHGDNDTASEAFLYGASPQIAVICTDSQEKPETPDARILAALERFGAETYVTQQATGGVLAYLQGGVASAELVELAKETTDMRIVEVVPGEDRIVIENAGKSAQSLKNWYLFSSRGEEIFCFGNDAQLEPGGRLTIGTNSTEGAYDLLWDDKKVIHKSKEDFIILYDDRGWQISALSNGY